MAMVTAPSFLWRSYASTPWGTLYSWSISMAFSMWPSTPPLEFISAM
jgi:hypothetical protein